MDWLAGTIPFERVESCKRYLERLFETEPEDLNYGQYRYDKQHVFHPFGVRLFFDSSYTRSESAHAGRALLVFSGSSLQSLDCDQLFKLFADLVDLYWMKATRLDLCFDDYKRIILPHEVAEVAKEGNVSGFRVFDTHQPQKINGGLEGDSVVFGRRGENGSGKYLRCYDKQLESKGDFNCIRWEVEFSKEKASGLFFALSRCSDVEEFAAMVGAFIGGSIDFVVRKDKNLGRAERLGWWADIVEILGSCRMKGSKPLKIVEKSKAWVSDSVSPSLRMLFKAYGNNDFWSWMQTLVSDTSLNGRHHATVKEFWKRQGKPENEVPF